MNDIITYAEFGARLRRFIGCASPLAPAGEQLAPGEAEAESNRLALALFALQFEHVLPYRRLCLASGASPGSVAGQRAAEGATADENEVSSPVRDPLTPALSPRERENRIQPCREPTRVPSTDAQTVPPPLPWGEGRGEGEQGGRTGKSGAANDEDGAGAGVGQPFEAAGSGGFPAASSQAGGETGESPQPADENVCPTNRACHFPASWAGIPAVPAAAFKEWAFTSLAESERTTVFHSSGTTVGEPSRHWHNAESLALYEASLWPWFQAHCLADVPGEFNDRLGLVFLTPPLDLAPHSSLVHMFDAVRRNSGARLAVFTGLLSSGGGWELDVDRTLKLIQRAQSAGQPLFLLGAAFSFAHLLGVLAASGLRCHLPPGSRVLETGGYKGRSGALPKAELYARITRQLGVPPSHVVSEYGMCELSSQAYDGVAGRGPEERRAGVFRFPPWARALVISPETGRVVGEGETGLLRVYDLANVRSVLGIQTDDLAVRRQDGFELAGRAGGAAPRGCSRQFDAGGGNS